MMIATRYDIIELSRASDGDYQLRINTDRWVPVDRPMLVAIHQAAWHLLGQQQAGRQTIKGRYPTDTVTLAYGAPDGYALRIGTGRPVFLDRPHLQALHDEVAQLLQHGES